MIILMLMVTKTLSAMLKGDGFGGMNSDDYHEEWDDSDSEVGDVKDKTGGARGGKTNVIMMILMTSETEPRTTLMTTMIAILLMSVILKIILNLR